MLKRYDIKSDALCEGWAIIVIDTDIGFFATVSDWGSYAYIWSAPGCEFRKFLCELETDYLRGKLLMGRGDTKVFNSEATMKAIEEAIEEKNTSIKERGKRWSCYIEELRAFNTRPSMDERDFEVWCTETTLDEPWNFAVWGPNPQATAFCKRVMPRFKKMLEDELEAEKPKGPCTCDDRGGASCDLHKR